MYDIVVNLFLISRLLIALILLLSSISKIFDFNKTVSSMSAFGIQKRYAYFASKVLISCELLISFLVFFPLTSKIGSIMSAGLFLLFVFVVFNILWRGKIVSCNCFGQFSPNEITKRTFYRNIIFFFLSLICIYTGYVNSFSGEITNLIFKYKFSPDLLLFGAIALCVIIVNYSRILNHTYAIGGHSGVTKSNLIIPKTDVSAKQTTQRNIVEFNLESENGKIIRLGDILKSNKRKMLLLLHSGCDECNTVLKIIGKSESNWRQEFDVVILGDGDVKSLSEKAREYECLVLYMQEEDKRSRIGYVSLAYNLRFWPSALIVDEKNNVVTELIDDITDMLAFLNVKYEPV